MAGAQRSMKPAYSGTRIAGLTTWTVVLLVAVIVIEVATVGMAVFYLDIFNDALAGRRVSPSTAYLADGLARFLGISLGVVVLASFVLYLVWQYHVNRNFHALGFENMSFSPGWSVGWWFIPLANLIQVPRVVGELRRLAQATEAGRTWQVNQGTGLVIIWWLLYVLGTVADRIVVRRYLSSADINDYVTATWIGLGGSVCAIVASVLLIRIVQDIKRGQIQMIDRTQRPPAGQ